jgi:hypothetical protein
MSLTARAQQAGDGQGGGGANRELVIEDDNDHRDPHWDCGESTTRSGHSQGQSGGSPSPLSRPASSSAASASSSDPVEDFPEVGEGSGDR